MLRPQIFKTVSILTALALLIFFSSYTLAQSENVISLKQIRPDKACGDDLVRKKRIKTQCENAQYRWRSMSLCLYFVGYILPVMLPVNLVFSLVFRHPLFIVFSAYVHPQGD